MKVLNKATCERKGNQIYIGRGTPYGNPFPKKQFRNDRNIAVALHTQYFIRQLLTSANFRDELGKLNNFTDVVCHCFPEDCHGNIIKEYVELREEFGEDEAIRQLIIRKRYRHTPTQDGVSHINIYSKSTSKLGLMLTHFARSPFEHPVYGKFESVEGFWYYLKHGCKHEHLRSLFGFEAKKKGQELNSLPRVEIENFDKIVEEANEYKILQNPSIHEEFLKNTKPFMHYYYYGKMTNAKVVPCGDLLPKMFNNISKRLKPTFTTIIAGSRDFCDIPSFVETMGNLPWTIGKVVEGGAKGADLLGNLFAKKHGYDFETLVPDWDKLGKAAGSIRNGDMEKIADKAVVFRKNNSTGSTDMINRMQKAAKEVLVIES